MQHADNGKSVEPWQHTVYHQNIVRSGQRQEQAVLDQKNMHGDIITGIDCRLFLRICKGVRIRCRSAHGLFDILVFGVDQRLMLIHRVASGGVAEPLFILFAKPATCVTRYFFR